MEHVSKPLFVDRTCFANVCVSVFVLSYYFCVWALAQRMCSHAPFLLFSFFLKQLSVCSLPRISMARLDMISRATVDR